MVSLEYCTNLLILIRPLLFVKICFYEVLPELTSQLVAIRTRSDIQQAQHDTKSYTYTVCMQWVYNILLQFIQINVISNWQSLMIEISMTNMLHSGKMFMDSR